MIEIPAAALLAQQILEEVDFLSIGTNDLAQYTFAADRMEGSLAAFLDPWQPALLALVAMCAKAESPITNPTGSAGKRRPTLRSRRSLPDLASSPSRCQPEPFQPSAANFLAGRAQSAGPRPTMPSAQSTLTKHDTASQRDVGVSAVGQRRRSTFVGMPPTPIERSAVTVRQAR